MEPLGALDRRNEVTEVRFRLSEWSALLHFKVHSASGVVDDQLDPRLLARLRREPNDRTNGICAPQAGLGHFTVRAQSQAITVSPFGPLG